MAKTAKSATRPAAVKKKLTDAEQVAEYMSNPKLPFKQEVDAVRSIIKKSNKSTGERIKWKAPSYYYKDEDMVTFNAWATKNVHLVFHHPAIVKIKSSLLEGDYKDRRMVYFNDMKEIKAKRKELERVIKELIMHIDNK